MANTVETTSTGQVLITQISEQVIEVQGPSTPLTVEVATAGPQGPEAPPYALGDLLDVNTTAKVAKSVLYWDATAGEWKGDDINTTVTLTDGGAF